MPKRKTQEEFIADARKVHGDKYDYSKVKYVNSSTEVCIICPEHGEFWQVPNLHTSQKCGCPECGKVKEAQSRTWTTERFIEEARKVHGDRYDYSKTIYTRSSEKLCIICKEHGEFWMAAANHLGGQNCTKCSKHYVPQEAWNAYIGGYQPAQKWLKDRKGRSLSFDDIFHYHHIIYALTQTQRLMSELG